MTETMGGAITFIIVGIAVVAIIIGIAALAIDHIRGE